jgi:broad specificity phosphatase PhoE
MAKKILVRHGQSEFNAGISQVFNSELTIKGIEQANRVCLSLKEEIKDPDSFIGYVSPYTRCLQTAMAINHQLGIKFKVRYNIGESPEEVHKRNAWVGKADYQFSMFDWDDWAPGKNDKWSSYNYTNEAEEAYLKRLREFQPILENNENVLVVSHMTPILQMIKDVCFDGNSIPEDSRPDPKWRVPVLIPNCSITVIEDKKPIYIGRDT